MSNILQLVLDFQHSPASFAELTDPARQLPDDIEILLEVAVGEVEYSAINSDVEIYDGVSRELLSATMYFIEHALFIPQGNHYRTLGLAADATQEQIRKHFHLLMKILQLDREDKSHEWNTSYAMRINYAYSVLRDPAQRLSYDHILSKQGIRAVSSDARYNKGTNSASSTDSGPSRAALADLLTNYKEKTREQPDTGQQSRPSVPNVSNTTSSNVSQIAGNIPKPHTAGNTGQRTQRSEQARSPTNIPDNDMSKDAASVMNKGVGSSGQGIKKAPVSEELTSAELDSFQQLIRTQPTQRDKLMALAKNRTIQYRSVTVLLSIVLLVMVVVYVMQQLSDDTGVQPEVVQLEPTQDSSMDTGNGTADDPLPLFSDLPVEEPPTELLEEAPATEDQQLLETLPPLVPPPGETGQRPRRTIAAIEEQDVQPTVDELTGTDTRSGTKSSVSTTGSTSRRSTEVSQPASGSTSTPVTEVKKPAPQRNLPPVAADKEPAPPQVQTAGSTEPLKAEAEPEPRVQTPPPRAPESKREAATTKTQAPQVAQVPGTAGDLPGDNQGLSESPTFVSMAPPRLEPSINNNISDRELRNFVTDFSLGYEAGDLDQFMRLFSKDAQTQDRKTLQGIRKDYQELFQGTEKRQFIIDNLKWDRQDDNRATGEGDFRVVVQAPGDPNLTTILGKVTFKVKKGSNGIRIWRLFHTTGGTGTE